MQWGADEEEKRTRSVARTQAGRVAKKKKAWTGTLQPRAPHVLIRRSTPLVLPLPCRAPHSSADPLFRIGAPVRAQSSSPSNKKEAHITDKNSGNRTRGSSLDAGACQPTANPRPALAIRIPEFLSPTSAPLSRHPLLVPTARSDASQVSTSPLVIRPLRLIPLPKIQHGSRKSRSEHGPGKLTSESSRK